MADTATPVQTVDAPQSTQTIPLQDPGTNIAVNAPDPTQVATVPAPQPMLQPDAAPDYTQPTVTPDRESWWRRALDTVGSIMGGDQTIHITKTPDGTMTVTHDPSTTGEKWGRVAAAMLGGAAKGLAAGQGPGGAAKAAAAGAEFGQQLPQQALKQANEQAASMNAQQLAAANIALLHQKMVTQGLLSQQAGLTLAGQQADLFNKVADAVKDSPNATVLPTVDNMPDMAKLPLSYANALQAHTNGQLVMHVTPGANGKVAFTPVITDRAYSIRRNDKPRDVLKLGVDPTTKEPIIQHTTVDPLTHTNGEIDQGNQGVTVQYLTQHNAWMKANAEANKPAPGPKTIPEIELAMQQEKDPVKRQQFVDTLSTDQKRVLAERRAAAGAATAASVGGATGADALAALPTGDAATVKAIGEGRQAPPSRFTKEGQRIMGMVNQVYPDYDASSYPTYQSMRKFMTSGPGGVGLNFIGTARNHLDELESTIPDNVNVPLVGSAINWVKNAATRATSPQLKAFESARDAVSSEVAKAYAGKAITQNEHDNMLSLINESDSPDALRGSIGEFRRLLNGKLSSYQTQWESGMPRGVVSPNSTLEKLLGASDTSTPPTGQPTPPTPPTGPPATNAAPPIAKVPPGHDTTFGNGQVWRNVNGAAVRIK